MNKLLIKQGVIILVAALSVLLLLSCPKKKAPTMTLDPLFKNAWEGTLVVEFSNTFPSWKETSIGMEVYIDEMGVVTILDGSLLYNGDTIIENSSRIERGGFWQMSPTGILKTYNGVNHLDVNANINVTMDVQHVYAKDNYGTWILVNTVDFTGTPNSDLSFVFDDALEGATIGVNTGGGAILWNLTLTPSSVN